MKAIYAVVLATAVSLSVFAYVETSATGRVADVEEMSMISEVTHPLDRALSVGLKSRVENSAYEYDYGYTYESGEYGYVYCDEDIEYGYEADAFFQDDRSMASLPQPNDVTGA